MKKVFFALCMLALGGLHAETIRIGVNGMVCAFCCEGIERALKKQPEVASVQVDLYGKMVTIDTKSNANLSDAQINKIVTRAGYEVTSIERTD
jgi:mercuric ion binding protein